MVKNGIDLWVPNSGADMGAEPDNNTPYEKIDQGFALRNRLYDNNWSAGHENPDHPNTQGNYNRMTVRVENRGCQTTQESADLRLYWTRARAWEYWGGHWHHYHRDALSNNNGIAYGGPEKDNKGEYQGAVVPYGQEITVNGLNVLQPTNPSDLNPVQPLFVPTLQGGEKIVLSKEWIPPKKKWYKGDGAQALLEPYRPIMCLLGRIVNISSDPMNNSYSPSGKKKIPYYAEENNNVVLKNTFLVNPKDDDGNPIYFPKPIDNGNAWHYGTGTIRVNHPFDTNTAVYVDFSLLNLTDGNLPSFNNYGTVYITLSDNLWDSWQSSGAQGTDIQTVSDGVIKLVNPESAVISNIEVTPEAETAKLQAGINFEFQADYNIDSNLRYKYRLRPVYHFSQQNDTNMLGTGFTSISNVPQDYPDTIQALQNQSIPNNTSIDEAGNHIKTTTTPNPFTYETKINYWLPESSFIELTIYDSEGKKVKSLVRKSQKQGQHEIDLKLNNSPKGIYYYELQTQNNTITKKLIHH